jgi:hypothetical protein
MNIFLGVEATSGQGFLAFCKTRRYNIEDVGRFKVFLYETSSATLATKKNKKGTEKMFGMKPDYM